MSLSVPSKSDNISSYPAIFSKDVFFAIMVKKLQNGNVIHDAIIYFVANLIYSFVERTTPEIFKNADLLRLKIVVFLISILKKARRKKEIQDKTATIKYITDNNDINLLFDHVLWYLNTHTETQKEENTSFQMIKNTPDLTRQIPPSKTSSIKYKEHTMQYCISSELKTIHAEREYKRDNRIITLTIKVEKGEDFLNEFCQHCVTEHKDWLSRMEWTQSIFRNTSDGRWNESKSKFLRSADTVILKDGQMKSLLDDIDKFIKDEEWYGKRTISWTRRFLFYGPTGTGKSSTIKAIASRFKRNIHFLLLSMVKSDEDLLKLLEKIDYKTTILVIEDIDCAVDASVTQSREIQSIEEGDKKKEEPEKEKNTLTMAGLLNAIDGQMIDTYGQILIMTTNHPEKLDSALIRPGRVDKQILFGNSNEDQIKGLYHNFFGITPNGEYIFSEENSPSPAKIFSILLQYREDANKAWDEICRNYGTKKIKS